jgi:ubiquinone/menaquinone biosynthesis C-methylase UbiE
VSSDRLRDVYERRAEEQYAEPWTFDPRERKFAHVWSLVEQQLPCEAFLDAGCGDGRYLAAVARAHGAARIVGTDISERILATARSAAVPFEPELARANLESLPFGDAEFDLVLCSQVVEHLLDVDAGLGELARVLRPNGTLILTTDNARNFVTQALYLGRLRRQAGFDFPHRDFEVADLKERLRAAGLDIVNTETFRFSAPRGFGQGLLDRLDALLPRHRFGDIIAVVASRRG